MEEHPLGRYVSVTWPAVSEVYICTSAHDPASGLRLRLPATVRTRPAVGVTMSCSSVAGQWHGQVVRAEGEWVWLRLPGWVERLHQRRSKRVSTHHEVVLHHGDLSSPATLVDLSLGGGAVRLPQHRDLRVGGEARCELPAGSVAVRLMSVRPTHGAGPMTVGLRWTLLTTETSRWIGQEIAAGARRPSPS